MKELSIEEKAKRYDEAIEKFNVILNLNTVKESGTIFADDVRKIIPELVESEDERIKGNIIATIHLYYGEPLEDEAKEMIAWLGKQGEQKPANKIALQPKQEWSMYDETILKALIDHFEYKKEFNEAEDYDIVLWLKSLRHQSQWKPSEEQMDALRYVTNFDYGGYKATLVSLYEQLKKLREE